MRTLECGCEDQLYVIYDANGWGVWCPTCGKSLNEYKESRYGVLTFGAALVFATIMITYVLTSACHTWGVG